MRWFVEVSRVGDSAPTERYCVDAKAWQAALQEARKLRGDSGPLSKFSIELLDDGYRAVDPVQKVRYLVNQAPADAPLMMTPPNGASGASPSSPGSGPIQPSPALAVGAANPTGFQTAQAALPTSVAPARPSTPPASVSPAAPNVPQARPSTPPAALREPMRTPESLVPRPSVPRPVGNRASAAPPAVSDKMILPNLGAGAAPAVPARGLEAVSENSTGTEGHVAADVRSGDTHFTPIEPIPLVNPTAAAQASAPRSASLLRRRAENPTPQAPITYREEAYRVAEGTARPQVEAVLRERLAAIRQELASSPPGQLVQLAVFDHEFADRPRRPPLGTLAWKDWRGEPVFGFPAFGDSMPPLGSRMPPPPEPTSPVAVGLNGTHASAPANGAAEVRAEDAVRSPSAEAPSAPPEQERPASTTTTSQVISSKPPPNANRVSKPRLAVPRRRLGEDLISELFELMHELHFARDIASGADYVLNVLDEVIPSEIAMVQVFDIDSRNFVVVRARGSGMDRALMHATPDTDPQIVEVMRRERARAHTPDPQEDLATGRWSFARKRVSEILAGPVRQGGRYLGVIEIANPYEGKPFHESEINAFDYICQQFAEFVASRPIVLD
ncbi:MAG TPA: hypothetical protein VIM73_05730, partial [Polyangiaceae bacterium]